MKKTIFTALVLLMGFSAGAEPVVKAVLNLEAEARAARARLDGVDSVILVLKDDLPNQPLGDGGGSGFSFQGLEAPKALFASKQKPLFDAPQSEGQSARELPAKLRNLHTAKLMPNADLVTVLRELNESPLVEYAEPNYRVQACAAPNDPLLEEVFALNNTGQPVYVLDRGTMFRTNALADADMDWLEVWTNTAPGKTFPTNEIIVAVIDTGVDYTHLDLTNQMWTNPGEIAGDGIDNDGNGWTDDVYGVDFYYRDSDPMDIEAEGGAHGTHVAGTIAAEADNGYGICGVNPHAKIMALKFLGPDGGSTADAIEAIVYAVNHGAQVLNNSWGGSSWQQSVQDAIDYAVTNGVVFLAASGNNNSGSRFYPAAYAGSISVNSMNWNDDKAYYSNYGDHTDVSAHGSDILSLKCATYTEHPGYVVSNDFLVFHGTSMACPAAAGAMSLLVAKHPGLHPYLYERVLETTCDTNMLNRTINSAYEGELGAGRVNVNRMLTEPFDTGFVRVSWAEDTTLAVPGQSFSISMEAGLWTNAHSSVVIKGTNLTSGIYLDNWTQDLGAMAALSETNLSTNAFVATVHVNSTNTYEELQFQLYGDGELLDTKKLSLWFVNGNARRVLVDDFDNDGTNDVAAVYRDFTLLYNNAAQLLWIAESALNGNWTFSLGAADLTGDGRKEIVSSSHRWIFTSGHPALFAYTADGYVLDGFPIVETNSTVFSRNRGFGEPAFVDVDEDGRAEIVCNIEYAADDVGAVRAYDSDATLLWERTLRYTRAGPPSAADIDGDGFEEIVVWNNNSHFADRPESSVFLIDNDGSLIREIPLPEGFIAKEKELHSKDKALVSLGDIDGDGDLELLLFATKGFTDQRIFAFHHDGTSVSNWPIELPYTWAGDYETPVLADADGDGDVEIFILNDLYNGETYPSKCFAFAGDGSALPNFPTPENDRWDKDLLLDDLDGNGTLDLVFSGETTNFNSAIFARNLDGTPIAGFDPFVYETDDWLETEDIALCNLGFNGNRHIAASMGRDLVIIDTGNPLNELPLAWPMRHQNPRRTDAAQASSVYSCRFTAVPTIGISNLTAQFTAQVDGLDPTHSTFRWDFDNNGSVDQTVFGAVTSSWSYTVFSNYTVALSVSNGAGQVATSVRSNYIQVLPPVEAAFHAVLTNAQAPITIRFFDDSLHNPHSWSWDFDNDGSPDSTEQNPEFYYDSPGTYPVTLTVSNDFGELGFSSDALTKTACLTLSAGGDTSIKYVSPTGLSLYPFKNWAEAATSIQAAIDATGDDETVLIDDGTYLCGSITSMAFRVAADGETRRDRLTIRSRNGAEQTVIRGWGTEPHHRAFYVTDASDITIDGLTVRDTLTDGGGGMFFDVGTGTPTIQNCRFINNTEPLPMKGGSCINIWDEGALIQDCSFVSNYSREGAVKIRTSEGFNATVDRCEFRANSGDSYITAAAIMIDGRGSAFHYPGSVGTHTIRNCSFVENTGWFGVVYSQPALTMDNCTFVGNVIDSAEAGDEGGAVLRSEYVVWAEATGTNQGAWTVRNTLFADNDAPEFLEQPASPIHFSYCAMTTPVPGAGNLFTNDPGLVSLPGDFHLALGSPCINAGTNLSWMSGESDLDGETRIADGTVDIGADETHTACSVSADPQGGTSPLNVSFSGAASSLAGSITNWTWNFGDGAASVSGGSLSNTAHIYTLEGEYTAVLRVTDGAGHTASNGVIIRVDDSGPVLQNVTAPFATVAVVTFDEPVDATSATNIANYAIDTVSITGAMLRGDDTVELAVAQMTQAVTNTLTVSDIDDLYGNTMVGIHTQPFVFVDTTVGQRLLFDFGYSDGPEWETQLPDWNNVIGQDNGLKVSNAVTTAGADSGIDLRFLSEFDSPVGLTGIETNVLYPAAAQRDVIHTASTDSFRLENLSVSNAYDLTFFASRDSSVNCLTKYETGSRNVSLQPGLNISNTVTLSEVIPDGSGHITVTVSEFGHNNRGHIGVLDVYTRTPGILLSSDGSTPEAGVPSVTVEEGTSRAVYIKLASAPTADVTVSLARVSGDLDISADTNLTFNATDWDSWKSADISAAQDADSVSGVATIQVSSAWFITRTIEAAEVDDDLAAVQLPFSEPFEDLTLGDLAGQHGWTGGGTVQTGTVFEGTQALSLAEETASHTFIGNPTNIWITFQMQPTLSERPPDTIPAGASAVFYVNTDRQLVAYSNETPIVIESPIFSNGWNKIELSCDYVSKVWNLELNEVPMVGNFPFHGNPASFQGLEFTENSESNAFFDSINITDSQDDSDGDGLPDSWEEQYWPGDLSHSPGDMASNGVDTVWATYIAGLDPTDENAVFLISVFRPLTSGNILHWQNVSGRVYSVWWSSNLLSSFQPLETNLPWTEMPYTDTNHTAEEKGFYKIDVELE